jgi:recombination protein RecA
MFSVVALPAVLAQFSPRLIQAQALTEAANRPKSEALPFGVEELDQVLPDHGLLRGGVVELAVAGASGLSTTLALAAIKAFQRPLAHAFGKSEKSWCAFVDPSGTLYAPGVAASGVALERLLVVRPPLEAVSRVALKLAESGVFELVVVDLLGTLGQPLELPLDRFGRVVRRLSMAVDGTQKSVVLLTDARQPRALPLPVAQRIELSRKAAGQLLVRVAKDRRGRVSPQRPIAWTKGSNLLDEDAHVRKLA